MAYQGTLIWAVILALKKYKRMKVEKFKVFAYCKKERTGQIGQSPDNWEESP